MRLQINLNVDKTKQNPKKKSLNKVKDKKKR